MSLIKHVLNEKIRHEKYYFIFPGYHLATLRRTLRSASRKLAEELARIRRHTISQLGECFTGFIPK
jgi:hypothetical protein